MINHKWNKSLSAKKRAKVQAKQFVKLNYVYGGFKAIWPPKSLQEKKIPRTRNIIWKTRRSNKLHVSLLYFSYVFWSFCCFKHIFFVSIQLLYLLFPFSFWFSILSSLSIVALKHLHSSFRNAKYFNYSYLKVFSRLKHFK